MEFYNDSKATNVDATMKAVASFAGRRAPDSGRQGQGLGLHADGALLLRERVKRCLYHWFSGGKDCRGAAGRSREDGVRAETLDRAAIVRRPRSAAIKTGDVVLLAPACSSFDQFENYEHSGRTCFVSW